MSTVRPTVAAVAVAAPRPAAASLYTCKVVFCHCDPKFALLRVRYSFQLEIGEAQAMWLRMHVRVRTRIKPQKRAHPARVADVGQENIETVHEPEPIQAVDFLCMDKVAVLWRNSTAHKPGT
ncbi:hypothetical protein GGU11DRAFT_880401 [Lentinula aff. detonsa]|uniref:Uncharacterized protein n=1 Tax=Lentinula aff. detonsa TaxID=2804958 RepID=A0AA38NP11_9AGAR|nr:hypothetical protein GGU10DRAFT_335517 [Lentinula aff. detonsa]KAJ3793534.1 hypothetical protein GGU11DRAFT_880401 [Lentinula aff. detonsa]